MKGTIKKSIEVTFVLNEYEAKSLRAFLMYAVRGREENPKDKKVREGIIGILKPV